eukprot:gene23771-30035_t
MTLQLVDRLRQDSPQQIKIMLWKKEILSINQILPTLSLTSMLLITREMYLEMLAPLTDAHASKYDIAYARAVEREMVDEAAECSVSESDNEDEEENYTDTRAEGASTSSSHRIRRVPKMALVNGHFRGATPVELSRLTRVELSMVSIVNCIYTLSMLKKGSHWGSTATVFTVLNDVNAIAEHLPRLPSLQDTALIRSAVDSTSPRDFLYSPHNVTQALLWLEENNPLWEGKFKRPVGAIWANPASRETQEIECIFADDEDYEGLDPELNGSSGSDGHAVNPNAPPSNMTDVLLTGSQDTQDLLRQVERVVSKQNCEEESFMNDAQIMSTEIEIMKRLRHENIVSLCELYESSSRDLIFAFRAAWP